MQVVLPLFWNSLPIISRLVSNSFILVALYPLSSFRISMLFLTIRFKIRMHGISSLKPILPPLAYEEVYLRFTSFIGLFFTLPDLNPRIFASLLEYAQYKQGLQNIVWLSLTAKLHHKLYTTVRNFNFIYQNQRKKSFLCWQTSSAKQGPHFVLLKLIFNCKIRKIIESSNTS